MIHCWSSNIIKRQNLEGMDYTPFVRITRDKESHLLQSTGALLWLVLLLVLWRYLIALDTHWYCFYGWFPRYWAAVFPWLSTLVTTDTRVSQNSNPTSINWKIHCNYQVFPRDLENEVLVASFEVFLSKAFGWGLRVFECCLSLVKTSVPQLVNRASLVAQTVRNLPAGQETWVWYLGQEDPLEEERAIKYSCV